MKQAMRETLTHNSMIIIFNNMEFRTTIKKQIIIV